VDQQVERWFAFLTDQLLRHEVHKNVVALEKDFREWITNRSADPILFVWTRPMEHRSRGRGAS
jgi:hypothetical protein